ncbi:MAG TPA: ECF-type sigma factor [Gemmataceae bacterium]|nr:ECF-type sigma factor [Gemmataceae bacterium]
MTLLLERLRAGDPEASADATTRLWARYFSALMELARKRLPGNARRAADEEDIALSALDSFCRGEAAGRFPFLEDRDALWRLLATITLRKVSDVIEREGRKKRGSGRAPAGAGALDELLAHEPSPDMAAELADDLRHLIERLDDDKLRQLASLKIQGHTEEEMAVELGVSPRTVRRKLELIRRMWEREVR